MLPKRNKLTKKKDFEKVFKQGKGFSQGFLYLKIKKNELSPHTKQSSGVGVSSSRFAIVVSKKFSKKAVDRNKIRRHLQEIIGPKLAQIKQNIDGVLIVNPGAEKDFQKLEQSINKLFKKAKII